MDYADRSRLLVKLRSAAIVVGLLLLVALLICIVQRGPDPASLAALGYPGIAILMFLSSSTILFPAPGFAAVLAAGAVWNPLLVGLAAGVGAATGELSGYLLGVGGGVVLDLKEGKKWRRAHHWLERYGIWALLVLAAVPNPLFDVAGIVAGSLSFPVWRFWIACALGNSLKYAVLAHLASRATAWWLA